MGIFYRRPLCFFAFLYMISAVLALFMAGGVKIVLAMAAVVGFGAALIVGIIKKEKQPQSFFVAISAITVCISLFLSYAAIDKKQAEAETYTGDRYAYMTVVSDGEISQDSDSYSAYEVILDGVRDTPLSIRARLICAFDTELYLGDQVYAFCSVYESGASYYSFIGDMPTDEECLLEIIVYDAKDAVTDSRGRELTVSELLKNDHAFTTVSVKIRSFVKGLVFNTFSEDVAPIAQGILTGDTSEISLETMRDFKRTGGFHLLSVSGLHITVLLGAVELLLKKLRIPKNVRIVAVSAFSFGLLVITGFSMCAARSVLMLLLTYVFYLMSEESDALTSLFCAVAIILIIWPAASDDLGLWMSFAATLGILTAYSFIISKIPRVKGETVLAKLKSFGRYVIDGAILSICATALVIPFLWLFFGETSIIFIPVNFVLNPVIPIFLCGIPIALLLAPIPFVGEVVSACVGFFGRVVLWTVRFFSEIDLANVSLRYDFAAPILIAFTVSLAIGLAVRLKRKWLSLIAPAVCLVAFAACVVCFNLLGFSQSTFFYADSKNELLCSTDDGAMTIVDVSNGSYGAYKEVINEASRVGSTYVDSLVLTHIDSRHEFAVSYLLQRAYVKTLYIPSRADAEIAIELCRVAERCGTSVVLYDTGEIVELDGGERFLLVSSENIVFALSDESTVTYVEACAYSDKYAATAKACDAVIFGAHGGLPAQSIDAGDMNIIVSSPELALRIRGMTVDNTKVVGEYPFEKTVKIKGN